MSVYLAEDTFENECLVIEFKASKKEPREIVITKQEILGKVSYGVRMSFIADKFHPTLRLTEEEFKEFAKLAGELAAK